MSSAATDELMHLAAEMRVAAWCSSQEVDVSGTVTDLADRVTTIAVESEQIPEDAIWFTAANFRGLLLWATEVYSADLVEMSHRLMDAAHGDWTAKPR
jgi:hypothetical protein